jgi:tRNA(Ile)-lysidine synthase
MAERQLLVDHVRRALAACDPPATDVVVAVSGGPDSVALLRAIVEAVPGQVVVAHVNHGWRGTASDGDEAFVRDLAERLRANNPRVSFQLHRAARRRTQGNREANARRQRYGWLAKVAAECGIRWVATGHTTNDQAETVLFRLLRGTGLDGLRGIAPIRQIAGDVRVVRPLLTVTRQGVLDYLAQIDQDYRIDASNADRRFTRNRIRHDLLPLLALEFNPRVREVLSALASQAAEAHEVLGDAAVALLERARKPPAGDIEVLDTKILADAPVAVVRRAWRLLWKSKHWPMGEMGYREWTRLAELCRGGFNALDLPGCVRARRRTHVIQVGPANGET